MSRSQPYLHIRFDDEDPNDRQPPRTLRRERGQATSQWPEDSERPSMVTTVDAFALATWFVREEAGEVRILRLDVGETNGEWVLRLWWPPQKNPRKGLDRNG